MSDPDYDALRKVAEAATPGPWHEDGPFWVDPPGLPISEATVETRSGVTGAGRVLVHPGAWETKDADATHIAAFDPPTVLRLLDLAQRAEAAEADCDRWKTLANRLRGDGAALGRVRELIRPQWRANRGYYHRNTSEAYKAGRDDLIDAIRAALDRKEDQ